MFDWSFGDATVPAPERPADPGRLLAGRYRLEGSLGEGGMGQVLRAHDLVADRPVAVKLLRRSLDEQQRARFAREGELTASLRHPGIVRIHGGGVTDDRRPFLVLELVEGAHGLDQVQDPRRRLELLLEVARAVGHAHRHGVVHRDLKPENVLVDAQGRARVCDFGLAWSEAVTPLTQSGALLGTPLYMAPELFNLVREGPPQPTADVWSLGVMLYAELTGQLPFQAGVIGELMAQVAGADPQPPRALAPEVPRALEAVCQRALARAPQDRYPDADAFADALDLALAAPGAASPRRWLWALPLAIAALALLVAALPPRRPPPAPAPPPGPAAAATPTPRPPDAAPRASLETAAAARGLEALLPRAHALTGLQPGVLAEFARLHELAAGDPVLADRIALERLGYLYRRGRWDEVLEQVGPFEQRPGPVGLRATLLRVQALYEQFADDRDWRGEARELCQRRWDAAADRSPVVLTLGAWEAILRQDMEQAQERIGQALRDDPRLVPALLAQGVILARGLRLEEAAATLERARALEPDNPTIYRGLLNVQRMRDRGEASVLALSELLVSLLEPEPPAMVLRDHASLLYNMRRHAEARQACERVLRRDPRDARARFFVALCLLSEGASDRGAMMLRALRLEDPASFERLLEDVSPVALQERLRGLVGQAPR